MMPKFKIRCSAIHLIMGRVGLTEKQEETLKELQAKPKLTAKQEETLSSLLDKQNNPELPATATSYLKKWYAETRFGYYEETGSKYTEKGHLCELNAIEMVGSKLDLFGLEKNEVFIENDFLTGTPDIVELSERITIDTKCPWDGKTYLERVIEPLDPEYFYQGQGYMDLTHCTMHHVAFCLIDTPEEVNWGKEIEFHANESERVHIKSFAYDPDVIKSIYDRVVMCRDWLESYHQIVESRLNG
jgi:hypothetical protein